MAKDIGEKIKKLRLKAGYETLGDLYRASGVSVATLSRIEAGVQIPSPTTLKKLAPHLGVTVEYLMTVAGYLPEDEKQAKPIDTREWYNRDDPPSNIELEEFLRQSNVQFNGAPLDEEDKEDIIEFLKIAWKTLKKEKEKGK
ncbi:helix-turn-helix domain-containing protein [Moorella sp. ACPs]|uniref:helix-turn-helix domain-containing protein n=1 Tax=Neomoorella carbonis TaxID=3062783 RepID=UPI0032477EC8